MTYEWVNPDEHTEGTVAGISAQNLEEVFPNWVERVEPSGKDAELLPKGDSARAISFPHEFNAYLIEALKEQQGQIQRQQRLIEKQNAELEQLRGEFRELVSGLDGSPGR